MKKVLISALILLTLGLNFSACKKELEPEFFSQLTNENFPKTEKDANAILTGFYANFGHDWGGLYCAITTGIAVNQIGTSLPGSWRYMSSIVTDETFDNWNGDQSAGVRFNWGPNSYWGLTKLAPTVARTTSFIDNVKNGPLPEPLKKSVIAETKCLRAWMMFVMYDFYGPINVRMDPTQMSDTTYTERPNKQVYLDWMIKDLTDAIPDLMVRTNGTSSWGKVNQGMASMLLMKIYMNDKQWAKAKTVAESISSMGYSLLPSYRQIFIQEGNNEVVWAAPSGINVKNHHIKCSTPDDLRSTLGQQFETGWGGQYMPWAFYDKYQAGDIRLETIAKEYVNTSGTTLTRGQGNLAFGAIAIKYVLPKEATVARDFQTVGFRYSDVLLSLAEIENELNGPTEAAVAYAKQITDRAEVIVNFAQYTTSKEVFRAFLSDERGRELYWEGWRRQDMIRMGTWIPWGLSLGLPNTPRPFHQLFPIRPSIVNESGGKIKQNPGY